MALGISVSSEDSINYHDDGFVDSIVNHSYKLNKNYGCKFIDIYKKYVHDLFSSGIGRYYCINKNGISNFHIFYLERKQVVNLLVRGHEETHFLSHFEGLNFLEEKILNELEIKINFSEIDNEEVKAFIGGIYSVISGGMTIEMLDRVYNHRFLDEAKNYLRGLRKK